MLQLPAYPGNEVFTQTGTMLLGAGRRHRLMQVALEGFERRLRQVARRLSDAEIGAVEAKRQPASKGIQEFQGFPKVCPVAFKVFFVVCF